MRKQKRIYIIVASRCCVLMFCMLVGLKDEKRKKIKLYSNLFAIFSSVLKGSQRAQLEKFYRIVLNQVLINFDPFEKEKFEITFRIFCNVLQNFKFNF